MSGSGARIGPMGESALLVVLGEVIDPELAARARAIAAAIEAAGAGGVAFGRPVPAYASVLVPFDPLALSIDEATEAIAAIVDAAGAAPAADVAGRSAGRLVEVPVRYGGADGPDLADVARLHDLRPSDVVELHAGVEYEAFFLGFAPGLPTSARCPRRSSRRGSTSRGRAFRPAALRSPRPRLRSTRPTRPAAGGSSGGRSSGRGT